MELTIQKHYFGIWPSMKLYVRGKRMPAVVGKGPAVKEAHKILGADGNL